MQQWISLLFLFLSEIAVASIVDNMDGLWERTEEQDELEEAEMAEAEASEQDKICGFVGKNPKKILNLTGA